MIEIPYEQLPKETLERVIEEFVTREGTNYGELEYSLEQLIQQVQAQLENKQAFIYFDDNTQTIHIVSLEEKQKIDIEVEQSLAQDNT